MNSNIFDFVDKHYNKFKLSTLTLRLLFTFLISYGMIVLVEILSLSGCNSISLFSKNALPFTIILTLIALIISVTAICLYRIKSQWAFTTIRCITNLYVSFLFLIASLFRFDGYNFSCENTSIIIAKSIIFLLIIPLELLILIKFIVPKGNKKIDIALPSSLSVFGIFFARALFETNSINLQDFFHTIVFIISTIALIYGIFYFIQAYYAKKYSINVSEVDIKPIPKRTLHTLK